MPAYNKRTQEWSNTLLSPAEASELGRAIGSETGKWYGGVVGAASAVTLGFMLPCINSSVGLLPITLILPLMGSASYFLGSYFGEKHGATHCKKIVENLPLSTSHTNQTVWDLCDTGVFKLKTGFIGFLVGTSIGVGVEMILSDVNLLGGGENISSEIEPV